MESKSIRNRTKRKKKPNAEKSGVTATRRGGHGTEEEVMRTGTGPGPGASPAACDGQLLSPSVLRALRLNPCLFNLQEIPDSFFFPALPSSRLFLLYADESFTLLNEPHVQDLMMHCPPSHSLFVFQYR